PRDARGSGPRRDRRSSDDAAADGAARADRNARRPGPRRKGEGVRKSWLSERVSGRIASLLDADPVNVIPAKAGIHLSAFQRLKGGPASLKRRLFWLRGPDERDRRYPCPRDPRQPRQPDRRGRGHAG